MSVPTLEECWEVVRASITKPKGRDLKRGIGPSGLGQDCLFCLGYEMARKHYDLPARGDSFGYAAWVGTMCHGWLEENLVVPADALREERIFVADIPGYGTIDGSADLVVPSWRRLLDWKWPGEYSYRKLLAARAKDPEGWAPSNQYRYQQQLYGYGLNLAGIPIEYCTLVFFPRHTNSIYDVIPWEEPYRPEMAELALARAEAVWEDVQAGLLWELPSHDDCFECGSWQGSGRPEPIDYLELRLSDREGATA